MNKLKTTIKTMLNNNRKVFVGCLTAGYPDKNSTVEIAKLICKNGVDVLELCVPFSDPVADGPTIQYSSEIALRKGVNFRDIFEIVAKIKKEYDVPVILMSYLNPVIHLGPEYIFKEAKNKGVDAFIIPDMIPENYNEIKTICVKNGISLVPLAAPNTPEKRLKFIDKMSDSFVYIVSLTGVTGARKSLPAGVRDYLIRTKKNIKHPRFIGFGISTPAHVKQVKQHVDGIIVASAIINIIRNNNNKNIRNKKIESFVKSLRNALDN